MRNLGVLTASAALVAVMGFSGTATAAHVVACGTDIVSGSHALVADLDCTAAGNLRLFGAELDFAGFTITCGTNQCFEMRNGSEIHSGTRIGGRHGVLVQGAGNYIHDMLITQSNDQFGINCVGCGTMDIIDNEITHNVRTGIAGSSGGGNDVVGNTVNHNGGAGISFGGGDNFISGNSANHNGGVGIRVSTPFAKSNTVEDNTTNLNVSRGILLIGDGHVDVNDNTANKNVGDGIVVGAAVDADLAGNLAFHNGDNGIQNSGTGTCPTTGPGKNKAKKNGGTNFIGCP